MEEVFLTQKQLEHRLDVTPMTIYFWRHPGTAPNGSDESANVPPLPCLTTPAGKRHRVLYQESEVLAWLEQYRPAFVGKFKENSCDCKFCSIIRKREVIPYRPTRTSPVSQSA